MLGPLALQRLALRDVADDEHHATGHLPLDAQLDVDAMPVLVQQLRLETSARCALAAEALLENLSLRIALVGDHEIEQGGQRVDLLGRSPDDAAEGRVHEGDASVLDDGESLAQVAERREDALVHLALATDRFVQPRVCHQRGDTVRGGPEEQQIVVRELVGAGGAHQGDADRLGPEVQGNTVHGAGPAPLDDVGGDGRVAFQVADGEGFLRLPHLPRETFAGTKRRRGSRRERETRGCLDVEAAIVDEQDAGGIDRGCRLQQGSEGLGQEGADFVDPECRGGDPIERLQGALAGLAVPFDRRGDGEIESMVQQRQLGRKQRRRRLRMGERRDALAQDGVFRHHFGEVVSEVEALDGVHDGKLLRRRDLLVLARGAHEFGQLPEEVGDVIEQRRTGEEFRGTQAGDFALPARDDLVVPFPEEIGETPGDGDCRRFSHRRP